MAMTAGPSKGAQSDINVTPLVDVVLVLLIIFMVVTPLLQKGLEAQVPKPPDQNEPPPPPDPNDPIQIVISVKRDGIYLNLDRVTEEELRLRLTTMMSARKKKEDKRAFISGSDDIAFASIVRVMDICRGAGVEDVGIIDPIQ